MTVSYEPGEEIQLNVSSKRKFFVKAMSWREQRAYDKTETGIKAKQSDGDTDEILDLILTRLTRTEPPVELTPDALSDVIDLTLIWAINTAIKYNLTHEEKKSSD